MARTWQQTFNEILKRAQMLYSEINNIRASMPPQEFATMAYSRKGKEHHTATLCRHLLKKLSPDVKEAVQGHQVNGMCGGQIHSWFEIRPDAEAMAQTGEQRIRPDWKYIVDPHFPDIIPPVLLVSPDSPLQYMYEGNEEFPFCEAEKH